MTKRNPHTVTWKPIKDADKRGIVYWLSGWRKNRKGGERYVREGYYSQAARAWCSTDLDDPLNPPTHFAEIYVPAPPAD